MYTSSKKRRYAQNTAKNSSNPSKTSNWTTLPHVPPLPFHFRARGIWLKRVLTHNTLTFPFPHSFNIPFKTCFQEFNCQRMSMSTHKYNRKTADGSEKSSMPNLMSSHRDEDKNVKNVEHFNPSLSEVRKQLIFQLLVLISWVLFTKLKIYGRR